MTTRFIARPMIIGAAATALASCLAGYIWHEQQRPPVLEIYVFALKTGRSMFIRTPDDQRILVDGGGNSQVIQQLTDIIPFYSRRIDTIIITNTDGKNVSGLLDVINRYDVGRIYLPKFTVENLGIASSTDKIFETFVGALVETQIHVDLVSDGDQIPLSGSGNGDVSVRATAHLLFPVPPERFDYSKASAPEVLFNISYGDTSVLFMGDASKKVQKFVASSSAATTSLSLPTIANADVLVVSHSAAPANMSSEFMNLVRPESLVYEKAVMNLSPNNSKSIKSKTRLSSMSVVKTSAKSSSLKKKPSKKVVADPLAAILDDNRFNLKEVGTVKIVSDGEGVIISGSN